MFDGTPRLSRNGEGLNQLARIGTFAEKVVCPAEQLVPIRHDMPWPQAALIGCCVPTGVGAVTRCAEVEAGASVLVIGCGGVGLNVVQGARLAGRRDDHRLDLLDSKLAYAKEFGATHTVNASRDNVVDRVREPDRRAAASTTPSTPSAARRRPCRSSTPSGPAAPRSSSAWPPWPCGAPMTPYMIALQEKCLKGTMYGSVRPNLDFPRLVDLYMEAPEDRRAGEPDVHASRRSTRASPPCAPARWPAAW